MPKSQIDSAALLAATLAGALAMLMLPGQFAWLGSIAGLTLLLILFAYDEAGYRTLFQSLAFSAVAGFCVMLGTAGTFRLLEENGRSLPSDRHFWITWLPAVWTGATLIIWAIDRSRMGTRAVVGAEPARVRIPVQRSFIPEAAPPAAAYAPPPSPVAAYSAPAATPVAEPLRAAPAPEIPQPAAIPLPPRVGKETMIYVTLVDEGLNVLRSVKAEHLGRDFYRILDEMPEGETWQFGSGQVVRCKKKNLSSGKALVAIEEAPRAS